jgi:hypothetical protein
VDDAKVGSQTVDKFVHYVYLGGSPNGSSTTTTTYDYSPTGDWPDLTVDENVDETTRRTRQDTLYILNPEMSVNGLALPQVEGINTPGLPLYDTIYSTSDSTENYSLPVTVIDPAYLGSGSFLGPKIAGTGGSVAVDPGNSIMFSVLGSDYTSTDANVSDTANMCKQATYLYTFEDQTLRVLTPLLWDSVELDDPPAQAVDKQYAQVGVIEFVTTSVGGGV